MSATVLFTFIFSTFFLLLYNKQFLYCVCFCIYHVCIWQMLRSKANLSNHFYEFLLSVGIEPITFGVASKHALLLESATWYPLSILGIEPKPVKNYWFSPLFVNCAQWFLHDRKHKYFSIIRVTHDLLFVLICFRFLICILQMQETILRLAAGSLTVRLDQRKGIFRAWCLLLTIVGVQWRVMWLEDEFSFTSLSSALSVLSLDSAGVIWNTTKCLGINITILTVFLMYVPITMSLNLNSS